MNRSEITISKQLEQRKNWKDAFVDSVAATFLVQKRRPKIISVLNDWEFLVTERVKGAEKGQYQAHHGGFMKITDHDIYYSATREVKEEVGYILNPDSDLTYLTSIGPRLFRSEMSLFENIIQLHISEEEAEPTVGFVLPLFISDVTDKKPETKTDGEVWDPKWMTVSEIIETFGTKKEKSYSRFNYFQMLVTAVLFLDGKWRPGQRTISSHGYFEFEIAKR